MSSILCIKWIFFLSLGHKTHAIDLTLDLLMKKKYFWNQLKFFFSDNENGERNGLLIFSLALPISLSRNCTKRHKRLTSLTCISNCIREKMYKCILLNYMSWPSLHHQACLLMYSNSYMPGVIWSEFHFLLNSATILVHSM